MPLAATSSDVINCHSYTVKTSVLNKQHLNNSSKHT